MRDIGAKHHNIEETRMQLQYRRLLMYFKLNSYILEKRGHER